MVQDFLGPHCMYNMESHNHTKQPKNMHSKWTKSKSTKLVLYFITISKQKKLKPKVKVEMQKYNDKIKVVMRTTLHELHQILSVKHKKMFCSTYVTNYATTNIFLGYMKNVWFTLHPNH